MKKLLVTLALTGMTVASYAQGTIYFANSDGAAAKSYVYNVDTANPSAEDRAINQASTTRAKLGGVNFAAALWIGTEGSAESALTLIDGSATKFRAALNGLFTGITPLTVAAPYTANQNVTLQVRVWDSTKAATWADVLKDNSVLRGVSNLVTYKLGATGVALPPAFLSASGLQSFGLFTPVPEPSVIALGALGLGALVLRRRK